jgi:hypothetical protein
MKVWKAVTMKLYERDGWIRVSGTILVDGRMKGFDKPLMYIGSDRK